MNNMQANPEQKRAIEYGEGPLLIVAGAGTGKTWLLTERISGLISDEKCLAPEVLALAFNDDAVAELTGRVLDKLPFGVGFPDIMTFHGFCLDIVKQYGAEIGVYANKGLLESVEVYLFVKENISKFPLDYFLSGNLEGNIKMLLAHFDLLRKEAVTPEMYLKFVEGKAWEDELEKKKYLELAKCYAFFQELKLKAGVLDFGDFHYYALKILSEREGVRKIVRERYKYVLVDEYQDTDPVQNKIIKLILNDKQNLTVVGDDDQCIYRFRGASIENILEFREDYPEFAVVSLTQNYRSPQEVLDKAYDSIQYNNPHRLETKLEINKKLMAQRSDKDSVSLQNFSHGNEEFSAIASRAQELVNAGAKYSDMAVLARTNSQLAEVQEILNANGVPTALVGARGLFDADEVARMIVVFEAIVHSENAGAIFNFLALPEWGVDMSVVYDLFRKNERYNTNFFSLLQKSTDVGVKKAADKLAEYMNFSRGHDASTTAYKVLEDMGWKDEIMGRQDTAEGELSILNVAKFLRNMENFDSKKQNSNLLKYVEYLDLIREAGENPQTAEKDMQTDAVTLTTVHRSKGLEWDFVFLPYMVHGGFPSGMRAEKMPLPEGLTPEAEMDARLAHESEERRLYYVAVTRARKKLFVSWSEFYRDLKTKKKPSGFLSESGFEVVASAEKKENPMRNLEKNTEEKPEVRADFDMRKFSFSSLLSYEICPRKFYYLYVQNFPTEMGASQQFGTQVHNILNEFMKLVQAESGMFAEMSNLPTKDVLLDMWKKKFNYGTYLDREMAQKFYKKGLLALSWFYDDWERNGKIIPKYLEKSFQFPLEGYLIGGRFDRVDELPDGTLEVIDYKTGNPKSQEKVDKDKQLGVYALACDLSLGQKASKLTMIYPTEGEKVSTVREEKDLDKLLKDMRKNIDGIREGNFEAKPGKFSCGYCDFAGICPHSQK